MLLQDLGPVYVKLGQVLSTRPDILPGEYIIELEKLQDAVQPVPYERIETVIQDDLGQPVAALFAEFDRTPLAAASLGQVHAAVTAQGVRVAVKVQRPDIRASIEPDLAALASLTDFVSERTDLAGRYDLSGIVSQLERTLMDELNYHLEARHTALLRMQLQRFSHILIPSVVEELSTRKVLTIQRMDGTSVTNLDETARDDRRYAFLADELFRAYLQQVCIDGFFHCDPHPGNVLLDAHGRLVLLDFGMVARISHTLQSQLLRLFFDMSENRGDAVADVCIEIGEVQDGFDRNTFVTDICYLVGKSHNLPLSEIDLGRMVVEIVRTCSRNHVRIPSEMMMLGKTFLNLDGICRVLDPQFNPMETIRDSASSLIRSKLTQEASVQGLISVALEARQTLGELPRRLVTIVRMISDNQLRVETRIASMPAFLDTLDRVGNRVTVGLITAAIIIGSALMMNVATEPKWLGYPVFAVIGFLLAGGFGIYLIVSILFSGRR